MLLQQRENIRHTKATLVYTDLTLGHKMTEVLFHNCCFGRSGSIMFLRCSHLYLGPNCWELHLCQNKFLLLWEKTVAEPAAKSNIVEKHCRKMIYCWGRTLASSNRLPKLILTSTWSFSRFSWKNKQSSGPVGMHMGTRNYCRSPKLAEVPHGG